MKLPATYSLTVALAWICTRDPRFIESVEDKSRAQIDGRLALRHHSGEDLYDDYCSTTDALEALQLAVAADEVKAIGGDLGDPREHYLIRISCADLRRKFPPSEPSPPDLLSLSPPPSNKSGTGGRRPGPDERQTERIEGQCDQLQQAIDLIPLEDRRRLSNSALAAELASKPAVKSIRLGYHAIKKILGTGKKGYPPFKTRHLTVDRGPKD